MSSLSVRSFTPTPFNYDLAYSSQIEQKNVAPQFSAAPQFTFEQKVVAGKAVDGIEGETKAPPLKRKWSSVLHSRVAYYVSTFFQVIRKVSDAAYQIFSTSYEVLSNGLLQATNLLKITKMFEVALLPFIIANLAKDIGQLMHGDRSARVDSGISIADEVGTLGGSLTTFAIGLATFGTVSSRVLEWATPLYLVSSILSVATVVRSVRTCSKVKRFKRQFERAISGDRSDLYATMCSYQDMIFLIKKKNLKDKEFSRNVFNCSHDKLMERLTAIQKEVLEKLSSADPKEVLECRDRLNLIIKKMSRKIDSVGRSSKLAAIVSVVSFIGAIALFASPIAPIAYGFIGLGILLNVSNLIYHKISDYKFTHGLGMTKKWREWIVA